MQPDATSRADKGKSGWRRVWNASRYSWAGLQAAWQHEQAFRQEVYLAAILLPLSFWCASNGVELALLMGSVLLVMICELINSALEAVVDRISLDTHPLSKRAKDLGSAVVMLALLGMVIVWACVLSHGRLFF